MQKRIRKYDKIINYKIFIVKSYFMSIIFLFYLITMLQS
jgi:hypothetical protein